MSIADHRDVVGLLAATPGLTLRDADSLESTARYLQRNPGLSFVCEVEGRIVGCVMSGHDGRRGYLQHLVVLPEHRRRGIARMLVERCLAALAELGIYKSHVDVMATQTSAQKHWRRRGWLLRSDLLRYSFIRAAGDNA